MTQHVVLEFKWAMNHRLFMFSFMIFTLLYYRSGWTMGKENNSILIQVYSLFYTLESIVFSSYNN
jgi:hypothetical protein